MVAEMWKAATSSQNCTSLENTDRLAEEGDCTGYRDREERRGTAFSSPWVANRVCTTPCWPETAPVPSKSGGAAQRHAPSLRAS